MTYFDSHSHPHFAQFDTDREAVYSRMRENNVKSFPVGTSLVTSKGAINEIIKNSDIFPGAIIGVHPNDFLESFDADAFSELIINSNGKVVGIGECGLDYFRTTGDLELKRQRENFDAQISFAVANDLPLMLHVRSSKINNDAQKDALEILKSANSKYGDKIRGTAHFFTSTLEIAKQYWDIGFATSFPGVITFAPETHEVVKNTPSNLILAETDAPYAAPLPYRGKRNEPTYVIEVVKMIAQIRGERLENMCEITAKNALRLFQTK